jgi:hypothetical protein
MSRPGDYIITYSGVRFWPLDPKPEEIRLVDIAHSLAFKVRWAGHCSRLYTVGTHSLRVAKVAQFLVRRDHPLKAATTDQGFEPLVQLHALLHDAHEGYLADVPRPVKPFLHALVKRSWDRQATSDDLAPWGDVEEAVDHAIFAAFGLKLPTPEIEAYVKKADAILLRLEAAELFPPELERDGCWAAMPVVQELLDNRPMFEKAAALHIPFPGTGTTKHLFMCEARWLAELIGVTGPALTTATPQDAE